MVTVYLGLGGNIGPTAELLHRAVELLEAHRCIQQLRVSSFYRTKAISPIPQRDFINAVCVFETSLLPEELLLYTQKIERQLGKIPKAREAPRPIDLDILLYGRECVATDTLQLPHPRWSERLFVLVPLAELTQTVWLPTSQGSEEVDVLWLIECLKGSGQGIEPFYGDISS